MRKPNKIERMNAYLYAWAILTGRIEQPLAQATNCVCPMLQSYFFETTGFSTRLKDVIDLYPEFAKQNPYRESFLVVWWPKEDKQSRITALENAIKLLA